MSTFQVKGNNGTTVRVQTQPKKVFRVDGSLRGPKGGPGPRGTDGQDGADGRDIELQSNATHVQWRKLGDTDWIDLVDISDLAGQDGADGTNGTNGVDGADGTNGEDGADGREVQLQSDGTYVQWRYSGDVSWTNLIAIASLKGADGADGTNGTDGADGYTPVKGVDYFDGANGNDGVDGEDGREVEFQKGATYIQWRYVGDAGWTNLVALVDLKGADGSDGTNGSDGADGIDGRTTLSGAGAPAPSLGEDGDFYINTSTYGIYGPKTAGAWGSPTSLVGPAGSGTGDMLASVYDPDNGARQVAFKDELGGGGVTDHGALTGLGDDDHTHYLNNTRGDARYYTKTQVDTSLGGKSNTGHTHDSTDVTDFDSAVSGNADVAANTTSRHTHTNKTVLDATTASFTTADETKLDGIEAGAEVNEVSSSDLSTGLATKANTSHTHVATTDLTATGTKSSATYLRGDNTWATPTNTTYTEITEAEITAGTASTLRTITGRRIGFLKNWVTSAISALTKSDVGLGNVDNTSDANKPVSTDAQTALDLKADLTDLSRSPNPYVEAVPLYSVGHSYTMYPYPFNTKYTGEHYMRVKDRLNLGDVVTLGKSGTHASDNVARLVSPTLDGGKGLWVPNSKGICLIQNTINELGKVIASDTLYRNLWAQSVRGEVAVMHSKYIKGVDEATGSSGSWTLDTGGAGRGTKGVAGKTYYAAHNSGAYKEWEVSQGDEVWVAMTVSLSSYSTGSLRVICNGVTLTTFDGFGLKPSFTDHILGADIDYTPWFVRVTGLNAAAGTSGSKTIRVQTVSSRGNCFLSGIIEPSSNPPVVFLAKEPPRGNPPVATYADNIAWYNSMTDTIASEFARTYVVDHAIGWDNTTMISSMDSEDFHPNDIGQSKLADNYVQAINENITTWIDGVAIL